MPGPGCTGLLVALATLTALTGARTAVVWFKICPVVLGGDAGARVWVYRVAAGLLIALAALTALTGARTAVVWFKICPVLLGGSAVLLLAASVL